MRGSDHEEGAKAVEHSTTWGVLLFLEANDFFQFIFTVACLITSVCFLVRHLFPTQKLPSKCAGLV